MSYLLDALKKSNNTNETAFSDENVHLYAQETKQEKRRAVLIKGSVMFVFVLIIFATGYYAAQLTTQRKTPVSTLSPISIQESIPTQTQAESEQFQITNHPLPQNTNNSEDILTNSLVSPSAADSSTQAYNGMQVVKPKTAANKGTNKETHTNTNSRLADLGLSSVSNAVKLSDLTIPQANRHLEDQQVLLNADNAEPLNIVADQNSIQSTKRTANINDSINNSINNSINDNINNSINDATNNTSESQFTNNNTPQTFDNTASEQGVSSDLLKRFEKAMAETMVLSDQEIAQKQASKVKPLGQFPYAFQQNIPSLNFQTHIYSSDAKQRWVKINDQVLYEGDTVAQGITLITIEAQSIIMRFQGEIFSLEALSNW